MENSNKFDQLLVWFIFPHEALKTLHAHGDKFSCLTHKQRCEMRFSLYICDVVQAAGLQ